MGAFPPFWPNSRSSLRKSNGKGLFSECRPVKQRHPDCTERYVIDDDGALGAKRDGGMVGRSILISPFVGHLTMDPMIRAMACCERSWPFLEAAMGSDIELEFQSDKPPTCVRLSQEVFVIERDSNIVPSSAMESSMSGPTLSERVRSLRLPESESPSTFARLIWTMSGLLAVSALVITYFLLTPDVLKTSRS